MSDGMTMAGRLCDNIDDIRARAEGVGFHMGDVYPGNPRFTMDYFSGELITLHFSFRGKIGDDKAMQAALDIIEAEERRQANDCPDCSGKGYEILRLYACTFGHVDKTHRESIIYGEGDSLKIWCYNCKGTGKRRDIATELLNIPKEDFEATSPGGIEEIEDVPRT